MFILNKLFLAPVANTYWYIVYFMWTCVETGGLDYGCFWVLVDSTNNVFDPFKV